MDQFLKTYTSAQHYVNSWRYPVLEKVGVALKLGVLCVAEINTTTSVYPAEDHPDVVLYGIACRDSTVASSLASTYSFKKSYDSYEDLLADPDIDFVYISLPTSLHFEWAQKALDAGKHVLLEPPITSNAREAELLVKKSEECGKVLLEASSWQFHPASHRFRQILDSNEFGGIVRTDAAISSITPVPTDDVRWQYDLSGGSLISMASVIGLTRYVLHGSTPDSILQAAATISREEPRVDSSMLATMRFKLPGIDKRSEQSNVFSTIFTDMARRPAYGLVPRVWELPSIRVETDLAEIYFYNAVTPHIYHYIAITIKETGKTSYESVYQGGPLWKDRGKAFWSADRYQLEAFVDKIRGRRPVWWIDGEDSVAQMRTVDAIYRASGLPLRPTSTMIN
ncbi:putative NAD binding Rossmann fold oxidoreductase [Pholiota conissans]|uniref:D-xylose 1-dehydrogenase (NADP(+), D-xylono-1,5-lactone-forming) n=1 Tax=Pholiota conissans TaxID=109636 RepID=A0A9P5YXP6_9AGAR|nr:putative NAD binding Rossmann fold oxidoreductase [Pholiota conissans]